MLELLKTLYVFQSLDLTFLRGGMCAVLVVMWPGVGDSREGKEEWGGGGGVVGYQRLDCLCFHPSHRWPRLLKWPFTF